MDQTAIRARVEGFPRWHYRFDLDGVETPIAEPRHLNRHEQRRRYFFDPVVRRFGGSLAGKRVLDLGCNAGFWSLASVDAGCEYVLGIDGRRMHVDQATLVFEVKGVAEKRYDFVHGNLFELDWSSFGEFDIVLCLGLLYHVSKHVDLLERIAAVNSDVLLIDTTVAGFPGSLVDLKRERLDDPRSGVDYALVGYPTKQAVIDLVRVFGYRAWLLAPDFDDYTGGRDYRFGMRRAFLCSRSTDFDGWMPTERNTHLRQLTDPLRYLMYLASKRLGRGRV